MFDILNVLYLSVVVATQPLLLRTDDAVTLPELNEVVAVSFHTGGFGGMRWGEKSQCEYRGVMVPYARDWEEVRDAGTLTETKIAAEPNQIAGYGILISKKECPGQPTERLLNYADWKNSFGRRTANGMKIEAVSLANMPKENWPKWFPQVMTTVEKTASTNQAAKDFVDEIKHAAPATTAAKEGQSAKVQ